jgi:SAM-dependent methyltransferase
MDLGEQALADRLVAAEHADESDPTVPLTLVRCPSCALVQIRETVDPKVLFGNDYPYFSSISQQLLAHFRDSAFDIIERRSLGSDSLVVEAASNDGYMLRNFAQHGCRVLGIDPAGPPAKAAQAAGIPTLNTFFTESLAGELLEKHGTAQVFLANNVLAHVPDLNGFVAGIRTLLAPNGVAVIECPYLLDLVRHSEFDTIYHQHLCYFSVTALDSLFRRHGLFLNDVVRTSIHGGSLRLFVERAENVGTAVSDALESERSAGAADGSLLHEFAARVDLLKARLFALVADLKQNGARIVGYGAAAKATTLLGYVGLGRAHLEYVADRNTFKQGRMMPGSRLSIVAPERIVEDMPDYVMILAWNFADEIRRQLGEYEQRGGRFIVPVPEPRILANV